MLDRERILAKLDELDGYLREIESIVPGILAQYYDFLRFEDVALEILADR